MFHYLWSLLTRSSHSSVEELHTRAKSLSAVFQQGGETYYVDEAIVLARKALELSPPGHPMRPDSLNQLSIHLSHRYDRLGVMSDVEEALVLRRQVPELLPVHLTDRWVSLHNLAVSLVARYSRLGAIEDLNEAISLDRDALASCPLDDPDRPMSMNNLAAHLSTRYEQLGDVENLHEAITLDRDALVFHPPGHPDRSTSLNNLAAHLFTRYKQSGEMKDIDEAITMGRETLTLCLPGHPKRPIFLCNLAAHLSTRYEQLGTINDLHEAIVLDRDAMALFPPGNPHRSASLNNLALHLATRYMQLGETKDLDEAIVLDRDGLELCPPGSPARSMSLNNLAAHLITRYDRFGAIDDLNEAIILDRDALALRLPGHPDRWMSLNNLATHLFTRHKQLVAIEDLQEAIFFNREALKCCQLGHPHRSMPLNNLALYYCTRYERLGTVEDITEAITLDRDSLALCPLGHPDRARSMNNLAVHLITRYNRLGEVTDLEEAIALDRDALLLRPSGHPGRPSSMNNLALHIFIRFKRLGQMQNLDEAIVVGQRALALHPPGHPERSQSLTNLASYLCARFTRSRQPKDKKEAFRLYAQLADMSQMISSADLSAARGWINAAEGLHHSTTVQAYKTSLRLLVNYLATLPSLPQHLPVLKGLTSSLAVDAFSACLRNHSPDKAVELLEQGRGVFWSQLARLRSPLDDVIASGPSGTILADEFTGLTTLIHNALESSSADRHDRVCHLNVELQRVVTRIRELPGLSRFLLPLSFGYLQKAARDGPVIIINASQYGCDALLVLRDRDPVHIPLTITKGRVRDLTSELHTLTVRAKSMNVTRELCLFLREVWDEVVSHIGDSLQATCPRQSRIWWCPTAEFSLLPLHAAGPYRRGQQNFSDLYLSSYTPTLTALICARRHDSCSPNPMAERKRFVAIGQANAVGQKELFSVSTELAIIGQRVNGLARFTRIEGPESCIARVTTELGKNNWVHLACHGLANPRQPFESAFALHDGYFTIQRIIQCHLENPQFAYLSACHTTVGDEDSPDEVIHLASAMQFAGFRSVIGTMWAVDDGETNKITSMFYDNMKSESGHLDHTRAAFALNKTMKELVDIPLDQRILYIHLGA